MEKSGQYQINGLDLYLNFGWFSVDRTSSDGFLMYPETKEPDSYDWGDQNGKEWYLDERYFQDGLVTLSGFMEAPDHETFWQRHGLFWAVLKSAGELTFYSHELDRNFKVFYRKCTRVNRLTRMQGTTYVGAKMDLQFQNLSYLDGATIPPYNNEAMLTRNIRVDVPTGNLTAGEQLLQGLVFTDYVAKVHEKVILPTTQEAEFYLSQDQGTREVGTQKNVLLTFDWTHGSIVARWPGGVNRSLLGPAIRYRFYNRSGVLLSEQAANAFTVNNFVYEDGTVRFFAEVDYAAGDQPVDNYGNNVGAPRPAGTSPRIEVLMPSFRQAFAGFAATDPRGFDKKIVNPINGSTFTLNVPVGAARVRLVYPATMHDFNKDNGSKVLYVEDSNKPITDNFIMSGQIQVPGVNDFNPKSYKVAEWVPVEPFTIPQTLSITL